MKINLDDVKTDSQGTGAQLPTLAGIAPDRIAAFRFETGTGWHAIPVQADERAVVDLGVVYDLSPLGLVPLVYTGAETFTGADPPAGPGSHRSHGNGRECRGGA